MATTVSTLSDVVPSPVIPGKNSDQPVIQLSGVVVQKDGVRIIKDISLDLPWGGKILISGRNGAGKSTLLRVVAGLIQPSSGTARILGCTTGSRSWRRIRRQVGYLNQESVNINFPFSAFEVAEIGVCEYSGSRKQRKDKVAKAMQLTRCFEIRKRSYAELSGGEKQKVSLARCMSQEPQILILDEPLSSLDQETRLEILQILENINRSKQVSVLMVSHDGFSLNRSSWIVREMDRGTIHD